MRYRQRIMVVLVLIAVVLVAAWEGVAADNDEMGLAVPSYTVANPRAGMLSFSHARVDNLVASSEQMAADALGVLQIGQGFDIRANCEAVFFVGSVGQARYAMTVYRVPEAGALELLGSDSAGFVASGPRRHAKALVVRARLQEAGQQQLRIVLRSSAKAAGMTDWVEDEDVFDILVSVDGHLIPTVVRPTPTHEPGQKPERAFLSSSQQVQRPDTDILTNSVPDPIASPTPRMDPIDPQPLPLDRRIIVANPRGHFAESQGYVDNFDQGHGRVLTVCAGDSVTFQSSYEFVWFDGFGGSAQTELQIRMQTLGSDDRVLGEGSVEKHGEQDVYRLVGILGVDVPFAEPGEYALLVTVRTRLTPEGSSMTTVTEDIDTVALRVRVLGEPEGGAISGVVLSESNDVQLEGIAIRVVHPTTWHRVKTVFTGPAGEYTATGLEVGEYLVYADPQEQNYLGEWWDDTRLREEATYVQVTANETTEGIDFALALGSVITGRVVEHTSELIPVEPAPIKGALIVVGDWETDALVAKGLSSDDGTYRIDRLPAGRYWVHANGATKGLIDEYWDDQLVREDADEVLVAAGEEVTGIDFALRYGGYIAGRVVGVRETAQVVPFKVAAYDWHSEELVETTGVGIGGHYWMSLPVGEYRVYAYDENGHFRPEYYDDVTEMADATQVVVTADNWPRNIDFQLQMAGVGLLQLDPLVSQVMPGEILTVAVQVSDVTDLAAFSVEIGYDPRIVQATAAELGDWIGSTGRAVVAVDPLIDNQAGTLMYGAASFGTAAGPQGAGTLAIITFVAQANGSTLLDLRNTQLTDTQADGIEHQSKDARVIVVAGNCIFGDLDCDCDVDLADIMSVALRWGCSRGDPEYDPMYDLDGDGDIDIVDVALVSSVWGDTCQVPDPAVLGAVSLASTAQPSWEPVILATGLSLDPSEAQVSVGEQLVVGVRIDEAHDLGGFEFVLEYDATQFSVAPADVQIGDLLASTGRSAMPFLPRVEVDGTQGRVSFGAITLGSTPPGPSGAGLLATVKLVPLQSGISEIGFHSAQVMDTLGQIQDQLALRGSIATVEAAGISFVPHVTR